MKTEEIKAQLLATLKEAKDAGAKAEAEGRDYTSEERSKIQDLATKAKGLKDEVLKSEDDDSLRKSVEDLGAGISLAPKTEKQEPVEAGKGNTTGERFTNAPEFKNWMKQFPNGRIPDSARGLTSPPVELGGMKALLTGVSDTSAGALVESERRGLLDPALRRPLVIRDVITVGTTGTDLVEWVEEKVGTNNAAAVAEATASSGTSGTKPESAMAFEKHTADVKTIAHWIAATKRALSDAGTLRTLIDAFLRDGLDQVVEDEIVAGDGTGEDFEGIATNADVQDQPFATDILTTYRKAKTKVRVVGRAQANAYLIHPNDVEALDLLMDAQDRFYAGGPFGGSDNFPLWRLPVVESEAVTEGTAFVGDFRKAVLLDREQATIQVSDSHADFFIRNLIAVLAELRAAFFIVRPSAIVQIDLTA